MIFKIIIGTFILATNISVWASKLNIVTTTPETSWLVSQIGRDEVTATSLSSGEEDLHYLEARIDYILKVKKADALCLIGLTLESAWLDRVIQKSGNPNIQPSGKGYCELGRSVNALGIPTTPVTRAMGDVHGAGNPHYTIDPFMMISAASEVFLTLKRLRPIKESYFKENLDKTIENLKKIHNDILIMLKPYQKMKMMSYHSDFDYWYKTYQISNNVMLEDKPGVPPSAGRLVEISQLVKNNDVKLILYTIFSPKHTIDKFLALANIKGVELPVHARSDKENAYREWQEEIANRIISEFNLKF